MGDKAELRGQHQQALELFNQALLTLDAVGETDEDKRTGLEAALHYAGAQIFYRMEDFWHAAEGARACLEVDPSHTKARAMLEELAPSWLNSTDVATAPSRAEAEDLGTTKVSPNVLAKGILALKDEGNALIAEGRPEEAVKAYTRAIEQIKEARDDVASLDSNELKATLFANRSKANLNLERWEEALADAEAALATQPDHAKALHRRGLAQAGIESTRARRDQGEALKSALLCKVAGNKRLSEGDAKAAAHEYTCGLEWLEDAHASEAAREIRVALLANRAQAQLKRRLWREALADADAALVEDPRHSKARFRRAKALVELGRAAEATAELEAILRAEPNSTEAQELLARARTPGPPALQAGCDEPEAVQGAVLARFREGDSVTVTETFVADGGAGEFIRGQTGIVVRVDDSGEALIEFKEVVRRVPKKYLARFSKVRRAREPNAQTEGQRLLRESQRAHDEGRFAEALERAVGAVALAEAEVAACAGVIPELLAARPSTRGGEQPPRGSQEARGLLLAYTQEVRCRLALRDFAAAGETAGRAAKLHRWQEQRLLEEFSLPDGLRGAVPLVELLASVSEASAGLSASSAALAAGRAAEARDSAEAALRLLERRRWPAAQPLSAALLAAGAEAAAASGLEAVALDEAGQALALDVGCAQAQALLQRMAAVKAPGASALS